MCILVIDSERRRLSLSAKRVEDQILPLSRPDGADAAMTEGEDDFGAEAQGVGEKAQDAGAETTDEVASADVTSSSDAEIAEVQATPEALEEAIEGAPTEAVSAPEPEAELVSEPDALEAVPSTPEAEAVVEATPEAGAAPEAPEAEAALEPDAPEAAAEPVAEPAQD